jgi:hypothetical protein
MYSITPLKRWHQELHSIQPKHRQLGICLAVIVSYAWAQGNPISEPAALVANSTTQTNLVLPCTSPSTQRTMKDDRHRSVGRGIAFRGAQPVLASRSVLDNRIVNGACQLTSCEHVRKTQSGPTVSFADHIAAEADPGHLETLRLARERATNGISGNHTFLTALQKHAGVTDWAEIAQVHNDSAIKLDPRAAETR